MPPRTSRDHALLLVGKAQGDQLVLEKLADDDDVIGFHAQQAVEKLLKAVLADRGVDYPRTHDIDRLVDLLEANNIPLPSDARRLDELTPWATHLRYDELVDAERLDRTRATGLVASVFDWVANEIEQSVPD